MGFTTLANQALLNAFWQDAAVGVEEGWWEVLEPTFPIS